MFPPRPAVEFLSQCFFIQYPRCKQELPPNVCDHYVGAVSYKSNEPINWFNSEYTRTLKAEATRCAVSVPSPKPFSEGEENLEPDQPAGDNDGSSDESDAH